jgi:CheY-like chemotaxis protein
MAAALAPITKGRENRRVTRSTWTILVVEDDVDIRSAISSILADAGYDVLCAADGRAALAYLDEGVTPDLILLDLMLPVMNGWDFRTNQRQHRMAADVPVIIMTASVLCREAHVTSLGVEECISKPFSRSKLLSAVHRYLPRLDGAD